MSDRGRRWVAVVLSTLVAALVVGAFSAASAAASVPGTGTGTGTGYIVNAIVGTPTQVVMDGAVVRSSAAPGSVVGPLSLTAGQHILELRSGPSVVVSARFSVAGGDNLDIVAHRAADRVTTPVITVFRNDLSPIGPGKTRLVVSHVAVAEPADIRVDGKPYFRNVANAESLSVVVPAGRYSLDVVPTTTAGKHILAPVQVSLGAGTLTRVFAYGNPDENTSDAVVQALTVPVVGAGVPSSVHTGNGGQAAQELLASRARTLGLVGAGAIGIMLAGLAGAQRGAARSARLLESRPRR